MNLYEQSASKLSEMLHTKQCSAKEIAQSVFQRIDQVEDKVNAYITQNREEALRQAEEVDKKIASGEAVGPLAGIPVGIKDNICTKNILTTCASKMLGNFKPPYNATVIEKLQAENAVFTGKLNMDEFAMGSSCETSYFKKTANPHNLEYVPGGSSGGSAAAVAAGECIVALGSDTGGSIRQPASFCGIVGLKPTYGTVSRYGLVAFASSLDQIGPMGRSVADVSLLYSSIYGHDKMDATSVSTVSYHHQQLNEFDINSLRIGIAEEYFGEGIGDQIKTSVMEAVRQLEQAGAKVTRLSLPSTEYALSAYYIIASAEASSNLARFDGVKYGYRTPEYDSLIDMYEKTRSEGFGDEVKRRIMLGTFVLSSGYYDAYYKRAKLLQKNIASEFASAFKECDVLITPTAPDCAFKIGQQINDPLKMYAGDVCTVPVNIASLPAISIPCGKNADGMPIGMQLIGPKFSETKLLQAANYYEKNYGQSYQMPIK